MTGDRERLIAENEALFRAANERASTWEERARAEATELYFCECADPQCTEKVGLTFTDYERVRSDSSWFFVVPGHEVADVERVIEDHGDWVVIEKEPDVQDIVEETDPRLHGG